MHLPDKVTICDVGPRDGLRNERVNVPTAGKIRLIEGARLAQALVGRPLEARVSKVGPVNHRGAGAPCS